MEENQPTQPKEKTLTTLPAEKKEITEPESAAGVINKKDDREAQGREKDLGSLEDLFFKPSSKNKPDYKVYVTLPPFSAYYDTITNTPVVNSIRFNSATKTSRSPKEILEFYKRNTPTKEFWIDLKCRQLRVEKDAAIPKDYLEVSHHIKVKTPAEVIFNDGEASAKLVEIVGGNKLRFEPGTEEISFGKGASLNILDDSFETQGFFTKRDLKYIRAAKKKGMHKYMLSYVEDEKDIEELLKLDPQAEIIAKIESKKGLEFVSKSYSKYKNKVRLMAATGDLYIEVDKPHKITNALEELIKADPEAIVASRILSSCKNPEKMPECNEILAVRYLLGIGYKNFMLGDEFCPDRFDLDNYVYTNKSSLPLRAALGLLEAILKEHNAERKNTVAASPTLIPAPTQTQATTYEVKQ